MLNQALPVVEILGEIPFFFSKLDSRLDTGSHCIIKVLHRSMDGDSYYGIHVFKTLERARLAVFPCFFKLS